MTSRYAAFSSGLQEANSGGSDLAQLPQAILRGGELGDVVGVERLDAGRRRHAGLVGEQRIVGRAGLEEELRPGGPARGAVASKYG